MKLVDKLLTLLVRTWDLDYTKVTPTEKKILDASFREMEQGIYFTEKEVWEE